MTRQLAHLLQLPTSDEVGDGDEEVDNGRDVGVWVDDEEFRSMEAKSPDTLKISCLRSQKTLFLLLPSKFLSFLMLLPKSNDTIGRLLCEFTASYLHKYATAWSLNSSLKKSPYRHDSAATDTIAVTSNKVISLLDYCRRRSQFRRSESAEAFTRW